MRWPALHLQAASEGPRRVASTDDTCAHVQRPAPNTQQHDETGQRNNPPPCTYAPRSTRRAQPRTSPSHHSTQLDTIMPSAPLHIALCVYMAHVRIHPIARYHAFMCTAPTRSCQMCQPWFGGLSMGHGSMAAVRRACAHVCMRSPSRSPVAPSHPSHATLCGGTRLSRTRAHARCPLAPPSRLGSARRTTVCNGVWRCTRTRSSALDVTSVRGPTASSGHISRARMLWQGGDDSLMAHAAVAAYIARLTHPPHARALTRLTRRRSTSLACSATRGTRGPGWAWVSR
jgi:hypothetical protein